MNRFVFKFLIAILFLTPADNELFASKPSLSKPPVFPSNVHFVQNKNQWEDFVRYEAPFGGGRLFMESNAFTFVFEHPDDIQSLHPHEGKQIEFVRLHAIRLAPVNCSSNPTIEGFDPEKYHHNYFIGSDASKWASDVPLFKNLVYRDLYPGIDMKFYSSLNNVKYDFIVSPGVDVNQIQLDYQGVDDLRLVEGELQLNLSVGKVMLQKPYAYQIIDGKEVAVDCRFVLKNNRLSFRFPHGYNKTEQLVIDPTLIFSSFTGSTADNWGFTATFDAAGDLYTGGNVNSYGFPTTLGAFQLTYAGGGPAGNGWACDMAIAKFNPNGTSLLYATYIGGSSNEQPQSLVVDAMDNLVIFGTTYSTNYPTTPNTLRNTLAGSGDMVISKLSTNGNTMLASTYIGGTADDGLNTDPGFYTSGPVKYNYGDEARGEIISDANSEYIVGSCSQSSNFPTTIGSLQPSMAGGAQDGVVFKINTNLTAMVWSTFLGGSAMDAVYDVVLDSNNDLFIAGGTNSSNFPTTAGVLHPSYCGGVADGFLMHLNSSGSSMIASTFIGTSSYDQTYFVELDYNGDVYTTGQTEGAYPVSPGVYSNPNSAQFIHKMNSSLNTTAYSTVFGNGSNIPNISPTAFLVDTCLNVYVAGWGRCISIGGSFGDVSNMPLTPNAMQSTTDGCDFYFFVLNSSATAPAYASYFGGTFSEEHVDGGTSRFDKNGVIYEAVCAGCGGNSDFPTSPGVVSNTNNSFNCNNGVIKLAFNLAQTVSSITTTPSSGCAPFTLTLINSSTNATNYIWDFGDSTGTSSIFQPTHTYTNPGVYQVMLIAYNTSSCNHNDTSYATITVTSGVPPVASFTMASVTSCDSLPIFATANNVGGVSYEWYISDGSTDSTQFISHVFNTPGTYDITLIVRDTVCSMAVDSTTQTVQLLPRVSVSLTSNGPFSGCAPLDVSFSSNLSSPFHSWNFRDGSAVDTSLNPSHTFNTAGTYDVLLIVSDTNSCNGADTAHVAVTVLPSIPVNPAFFVLPNSDCIVHTVLAGSTGSGGQVYSWNMGDGDTLIGNSIFHQYQSTGNFVITLTVTDTVCGATNSTSQNVSFYPPIQATAIAQSSGNGCIPVSVDYNSVGSSPVQHFWNFHDGSALDSSSNPSHVFTTPGTYNVQFIIHDALSCNLGDTVVLPITINPTMALDPAFAAIPSTACDSYYVELSCNPAGGTAFNWMLGDGGDSAATSLIHHYSGPGDYVVTLTVYDTLCGLQDTSSRIVHFKPTARAGLDIGDLQFGCAPQTVVLSNALPTTGTYYWDFGDGSSSTSPVASHTYTETGKFHLQLIVTDFNSCNLYATDTMQLTVYPNPTASFLSTLTENYFNADLTLINKSSGASTYFWNFDDGDTSTEFSVTHHYEHPGEYNVCLYASSAYGCIDTSCSLFKIEDAESLYVPNAFTPNGDEVNDRFRVESIGILEMHVDIFNRWGVLIYQYETPQGSWDGRTNNVPSPSDVYVYKIKAKGLVHSDIELMGKVTLVR